MQQIKPYFNIAAQSPDNSTWSQYEPLCLITQLPYSNNDGTMNNIYF